MAYQIKLGTTTKRVNSLSKTYTLGNTFNASLKKPCTLDKPTFTIKIGASVNLEDVQSYNYLEWVSDKASNPKSYYYWIDKITFTANNLIEISCHKDVLATYRSNILGYTGFIARATSHIDTMISDPNIITKPNLVSEKREIYSLNDYISVERTADAITKNGLSFTWTTIGTNGTSIFNTISAPTSTMLELLGLLSGGQSVWNDFQWGVTDPGQYIKDVIMLPFCSRTSSMAYTDNQKAWIGNLNAEVSDSYFLSGEASPGGSFATTAPDRFKQFGKDIDIPPLYYPADDFRNYSDAFTNVKVFIPYVGSVPVPARHLKANNWTVTYYVSYLTGKGKVIFTANYPDPEGQQATDYIPIRISEHNIDMGVPIAVSAGHTNQLEMARDAVNVVRTAGDVVSSLSKPTAGGLINSSANVMSTALETAAHAASGYQEFTSLGSNGSLIDAFNYCNDIVVCLQQYDSTPTTFAAERGRPVYDSYRVDSFTGFVQLLAPSLTIEGALPAETSEINANLASGIYVES